ncbi:5074_t:CDS:2 [Cetraspora pellucida]|uniref:5074_t:CDS:1 n=1 Tax=Cetraspora pellucida TaxID=1433469 RepID=A0A9N9FQ35_9GLOM|nr:5074_t:CDS:2 [Cetraspora pellucida]
MSNNSLAIKAKKVQKAIQKKLLNIIEGGFHKLYILKIKNGNKYIGKVAFPVYSQWKTESEVAVIEYIHLNLNIPVPKVYYWNSSVNNPVIESDFFTDEQATLSTIERGSFNTTNEYILAVIRNQILYNYTFKSKKQQKYWIPKYEELYNLVPKYFSDKNKITFVLMHRDFHSSNILVNDYKITGVID